jgi:peptidoglycan/xylan/chitin deacetylase (PgdA/CDA1 family)
MIPAIRSGAIRAGLETLYYTGAHRLARPLVGGLGTILTFHRVRPPRAGGFQPNRHLEISPGFLAEIVQTLRANAIDIVSMDEAYRRIGAADAGRRFAVLTFDDGYRDNLTYAWPILKSHGVPFTIYVTSAFADGDGMLWWMALEAAIAATERVTTTIDGENRVFDCTTDGAKTAAWEVLYRRFRDETDEWRMREAVREIATGSGIDAAAQCREACMGWDELATLAASELVTIGGHTMRHPILTRLSTEEARAEIEGGARRIETQLGVRPRHFAYPVGNPSAAGPREFNLVAAAGFTTAVTTQPGVLFAGHAQTPTALPRLSVNGEFQRMRYLDVLLSGAATAIWSGFRRVSAA